MAKEPITKDRESAHRHAASAFYCRSLFGHLSSSRFQGLSDSSNRRTRSNPSFIHTCAFPEHTRNLERVNSGVLPPSSLVTGAMHRTVVDAAERNREFIASFAAERARLGVAGGPLVMALVLGWLGRTGPVGWRIPPVANMVLRNLGLSVFIGAVAIGAGAPFVQTVATSGIPILLGGAAVLLVLVGVVLIGGLLLRIPFDDLLGVCAGSTGNPAILSAAGRLAPTDRPDVGYAICFPATTIVKIIAVQVLLS